MNDNNTSTLTNSLSMDSFMHLGKPLKSKIKTPSSKFLEDMNHTISTTTTTDTSMRNILGNYNMSGNKLDEDEWLYGVKKGDKKIVNSWFRNIQTDPSKKIASKSVSNNPFKTLMNEFDKKFSPSTEEFFPLGHRAADGKV